MILQSISNYISLGGLGLIFVAISLLIFVFAISTVNDYRFRSMNTDFMIAGSFFLFFGGLLIGLHFS